MLGFSAADQTGLPSMLGLSLQGGTIGFPQASFLLGAVKSGEIGFVSNIRAVEIAYVGNRGAWWEANGLININALTAERNADPLPKRAEPACHAALQEHIRQSSSRRTALDRGHQLPQLF